MNKLSTHRLPNILDLFLTEPKNISLPALAMTYVVFPLLITVVVISTGVVLPGSTVAAVFLFLAVLYSNGLIAAALAFALPKWNAKTRTQVHLFASSLLPFLLWRISVMILFNY